MSDASPALMGCPACAVVPDAVDKAEQASSQDVMISVPSMHCAACLSKIETGLEGIEGVHSVRANLSLKRVMIKAAPQMDAHDFIPVIHDLGYEAYELDQEMIGRSQDETARGYLLRLGVAGFAMMNVMLLSISVWTGASDSTRDLLHWLSALIAVPAVIYAAQPFFKNAWSALRRGSLNMDVPISLAIILALGMSIYETSQNGENAYFDAALSLTFFLLIGRYLDYRTRSMARSAAQELSALETRKTTRIEADGDRVVAIEELRVGDTLRILPGARIPVDGVVLEGKSDVDTSFISGESVPCVIEAGDAVRAGMMNLTGMLKIQTETVGEDISLHQLSKLVAIAENGRNLYTSLADRAARVYAPVVHLLALGAFVFWMLAGSDWRFAMNVAIAVLVITCPCALGLAVPAVNTAASGRLFQKGLLLKSETAMERLAEIDVVVFDKTGTLTSSLPELQSEEGEHLDVALALAQASSHPLSKSLAAALSKRDLQAAALSDVREIPGEGMEANWGGTPVRMGRASWVGAQASDQSEVWLYVDGEYTHFTFQDEIRQGVQAAIDAFQAQSIRVILLSGDREQAVASLAKRVGVDEYQAQVKPEDKAELIDQLSAEGHKVLMVGDGLNDTAALAKAYVSVSPGEAMDVARMASDMVLLSPDFENVFHAYRTARSAKSRILENFSMAATYNLIAIPIALIGLATPLLAALAMSSSSIMVVLNANRVRWMK